MLVMCRPAIWSTVQVRRCSQFRSMLERIEGSGPRCNCSMASPIVRGGDGLYALSDTGTLIFLPRTPPPRRTIAWVDRTGNETPLSLEPRNFSTPRLSPDGQQFAVVVQDDNTGRSGSIASTAAPSVD